MNRRSLFKGAAALTAGLILPPTLAENAEAAQRYWQGWSLPSYSLATSRLELHSLPDTFWVTAPDGETLITGHAPPWGRLEVTSHHPDIHYETSPDGTITFLFRGMRA